MKDRQLFDTQLVMGGGKYSPSPLLICRPETASTSVGKTDFTLLQLADKYLYDNFPATEIIKHEQYLSSLKGMVDYICGQPNEGEKPYIFDDHQWNLRFPSRHHIVEDMMTGLKDIDYETFEDFEQLIDYVAERRVKHFGDTAIYDFALRYGWNRNPRIIPKRFVYIHSKPLMAANRLKELGYLNEVARKLPLSSYSQALPGLAAIDVEHFLCRFHDEIMQLKPIKN